MSLASIFYASLDLDVSSVSAKNIPAGQWQTTVRQNWVISRLFHLLQSEWVNEQTNEWVKQSAQAQQAVRSMQMSEQCERMSEQVAQYLRLDFLLFWTIQ